MSSIIAPGAQLTKIAEMFSFTEGPAPDAHGNVYFTDQPNDRIMRWDIDGTITEWMKPCGRSNGMIFDKEGNLLSAADDKNELWSIAPDKKVTILAKEFGGKLLNGPNDVWPSPTSGCIYFTDPLYARDYWTRDPAVQQTGQHTFCRWPDGHMKPVAADLTKPNGIVGTPDGKILYVSDIGAGKTYRYKIASNGELEDKTLFCELGSDGMTIDNQGNVYLTGHGVTVFNPEGKQIEHIAVDQPWTANICFAGKEHNILFITASKAVYSLQMTVKGV